MSKNILISFNILVSKKTFYYISVWANIIVRNSITSVNH